MSRILLTKSISEYSKTTRASQMSRSLKSKSAMFWTMQPAKPVKLASRVWTKVTDSSRLSNPVPKVLCWTFPRWFRVWVSKVLMESVSPTVLTTERCPISANTTTHRKRVVLSRTHIFLDWLHRNCSSTRWVVVWVWLTRPWRRVRPDIFSVVWLRVSRIWRSNMTARFATTWAKLFSSSMVMTVRKPHALKTRASRW